MIRKYSFFLLSLFWAWPLLAQGSYSLLGQVGSTTGDEKRRDDLEAFRSGVAFAGQGQPGWVLEFTPEGAGFVRWKASFWDNWGLHLDLVRSRRFSDDSVYPERTPGGTPVSELFPYTNSLTPAFGRQSPILSHLRFRGQLLRRLPWGEAAFELTANDGSGRRTSEIGGWAFGEAGAPAFFPAALALVNDSQWQTAVTVRGRTSAWGWKTRFSAGETDATYELRLPTYGKTRLLEISQLQEGQKGNQKAFLAEISHQKASWEGQVAASWHTWEGRPSYVAGGAQQSRQPLLARADSQSTSKQLALRLAFLPWSNLSFAARSFVREKDTQAQANRGAIPARHRWEQTTVLAEVEARASSRHFTALLLGSREWQDQDLSLVFAPRLQKERQKTTQDRLNAKVSWHQGPWRWRFFGTWDKENTQVDLLELVSGYAQGDRRATFRRVGMEFVARMGNLNLGLVARQQEKRRHLQPPWYDPIYDPSWTLLPAPVETKNENVVVRTIYARGDGFSWFLEAGWQKDRFHMDAVVFPGFLWVEEEVRGTFASAGGSWEKGPWQCDFSASAYRSQKTVAHLLGRGEIRLSRALTQKLSLLFQGVYRRFDQKLFQSDDYTLKAVNFGLQGRF